MKTLSNTTSSQAKDNVPDIKFWGNGDLFRLISKAHSVKEGWMKSTKAMEVKGVGCIVQVTTQQNTIVTKKFLFGLITLSYTLSSVAEALTFVPSCKIVEFRNESTNTVISREIVPFNR